MDKETIKKAIDRVNEIVEQEETNPGAIDNFLTGIDSIVGPGSIQLIMHKRILGLLKKEAKKRPEINPTELVNTLKPESIESAAKFGLDRENLIIIAKIALEESLNDDGRFKSLSRKARRALLRGK